MEQCISLIKGPWGQTQSKIKTSCSFLGLGMEVGLMPNIMKGFNTFTANVIKDFPYNYDIIIQEL
jgi:hypothetical protein